MKNIIYLLVMLNFSVYGQVGINTIQPTKDLDVNGEIRVREVNQGNLSQGDSILVKDSVGVVKRVGVSEIFNARNKSIVKAGLSNFSNYLLEVDLLAWNNIPFEEVIIDTNNDFDTENGYFIVPNDGIYRIYSRFRSSITLAGEFGIGIFRVIPGVNSESDYYDLLAKESYLNVNVNVLNLIDLNVNPPTRSVNTVAELEAGDRIVIRAYSAIDVNLLGNQEDSYVIVEQID